MRLAGRQKVLLSRRKNADGDTASTAGEDGEKPGFLSRRPGRKPRCGFRHLESYGAHPDFSCFRPPRLDPCRIASKAPCHAMPDAYAKSRMFKKKCGDRLDPRCVRCQIIGAHRFFHLIHHHTPRHTMKTHTTFALALLLTGSLHADVIMEQKVEAPGQPATTMTTRIKGDKMRSDVGTQMSSIVDMKTGDMISLMHDQKMMMKMSGAQMKASMEAMKKLNPQAAETPKITATGKTEKVGEYNCTIYTYSYAGGTTTMWATKDLPNYAAVKAELEGMNKMASQMIDMKPVDGVVIKTQSEAAGTKTTTTVTSIKQAAVEDSIFTPPAGYKDPTGGK
jgi:hypothetical protein